MASSSSSVDTLIIYFVLFLTGEFVQSLFVADLLDNISNQMSKILNMEFLNILTSWGFGDEPKNSHIAGRGHATPFWNPL